MRPRLMPSQEHKYGRKAHDMGVEAQHGRLEVAGLQALSAFNPDSLQMAVRTDGTPSYSASASACSRATRRSVNQMAISDNS